MQPERGGRPRRGGGRPNRRRPCGRERQAESAGGGSGEDGGCNRGGGGSRGRGRGGGQGRRDARGRGTAAALSPPCESATTDLESQEQQEKEQGSYSRRKVVSNWHRYEEAEKETQNDSGDCQRGTDFSVLLSSAGDSFTQFRFAEEKEWATENLCPKQLSGLYVDCQSLVQALETLPLHLKLNVAAELVQDGTPAALPQMKSKSEVSKRTSSLHQHVGQGRTSSGLPLDTDSAAAAHLMLPKKAGLGTVSSEMPPKNLSVTHQETDYLDEDLDLLLMLDNPVNPEEKVAMEMISHDTAPGGDLEMPHEENEQDGTEESALAFQKQEVTPKNITEEDLEDWLDSMIS